MSILLTTDWHLTDDADNEYRWEVFDILAEIITKETISLVVLAGDLSDRKDRHKGAFVNRVVAEISAVAYRVPFYILKGNHDQPLTGPAYWQFLNEIEQVRFIDEPVVSNNCLFLPHSRNPVKDWHAHFFKMQFKAILMHQTVKGARDGATILEGEPLPDLPTDIPIYSGDIHVQQKIRNITYIGAPHPVRYGDSYPCRMLLLREDDLAIEKEIKLNPIQKTIVEITSLDDLKKFKLHKADQVRIRFSMPAANLTEWPQIEQALEKWSAKAGVEVASIEPVLVMGPKAGSYNQWGNPEEVLRMFAASEGIEGDLLDVGLELLR